jgi:hypothetical protein
MTTETIEDREALDYWGVATSTSPHLARSCGALAQSR